MEYILNAILVYLGVGTIIAGMMKVIIERCLCEKDRRVFTREVLTRSCPTPPRPSAS
jgi:hypothetical protein